MDGGVPVVDEGRGLGVAGRGLGGGEGREGECQGGEDGEGEKLGSSSICNKEGATEYKGTPEKPNLEIEDQNPAEANRKCPRKQENRYARADVQRLQFSCG